MKIWIINIIHFEDEALSMVVTLTLARPIRCVLCLLLNPPDTYRDIERSRNFHKNALFILYSTFAIDVPSIDSTAISSRESENESKSSVQGGGWAIVQIDRHMSGIHPAEHHSIFRMGEWIHVGMLYRVRHSRRRSRPIPTAESIMRSINRRQFFKANYLSCLGYKSAGWIETKGKTSEDNKIEEENINIFTVLHSLNDRHVEQIMIIALSRANIKTKTPSQSQ